jgi:membrane-bound ClpP family serine protease
MASAYHDKQHHWWLLIIFVVTVYLSYEFVANATGVRQVSGAVLFILSAAALNVGFWIKANWTWQMVSVSFVLFLVDFFLIDNNITHQIMRFFSGVFDAALHFK